MATKKPSSKKAAKKSSNTTKRSTKKNKNNAAEIINATENKELQTLAAQVDITPVVENNNTAETVVAETAQVDTTASTEQTPDTSSLASSAAAIHKDEVVVENASYNNMVVPQTKDNTYAFIIGGFVLLITLMLFFI
jgi:hypothetical protein